MCCLCVTRLAKKRPDFPIVFDPTGLNKRPNGLVRARLDNSPYQQHMRKRQPENQGFSLPVSTNDKQVQIINYIIHKFLMLPTNADAPGESIRHSSAKILQSFQFYKSTYFVIHVFKQSNYKNETLSLQVLAETKLIYISNELLIA